MSEPLSIDSIGHLTWGTTCLLTALMILTYDGIIKRDIRIISGLFITFLILQCIVSSLFIVYQYNPSSILSYITASILTMSGNIYLVISAILFLSPLHKNKLMKNIIIFLIPLIYISFLIGLIFVETDEKRAQFAYIYYIPCGSVTFIVILILYFWYKKDKFIFATYAHSYANLGTRINIHEMANWNLLFKFALMAIITGLVFNFIYPSLVIYAQIIPDDNPGFTVRIIDSLIFLPFITPLVRSLDKVLEYSSYRVLQYQIIDHRESHSFRSKHQQRFSDPSDTEQDPLRD